MGDYSLHPNLRKTEQIIRLDITKFKTVLIYNFRVHLLVKKYFILLSIA
jgi:hypothetical protein